MLVCPMRDGNRATPSSVQARRAERPRSQAYANCPMTMWISRLFANCLRLPRGICRAPGRGGATADDCAGLDRRGHPTSHASSRSVRSSPPPRAIAASESANLERDHSVQTPRRCRRVRRLPFGQAVQGRRQWEELSGERVDARPLWEKHRNLTAIGAQFTESRADPPAASGTWKSR